MNTLEITIKGDQGAGKTTLHEKLQQLLLGEGFITREYRRDHKGVYFGTLNRKATKVTVTEQLNHTVNAAEKQNDNV